MANVPGQTKSFFFGKQVWKISSLGWHKGTWWTFFELCLVVANLHRCAAHGRRSPWCGEALGMTTLRKTGLYVGRLSVRRLKSGERPNFGVLSTEKNTQKGSKGKQ